MYVFIKINIFESDSDDDIENIEDFNNNTLPVRLNFDSRR